MDWGDDQRLDRAEPADPADAVAVAGSPAASRAFGGLVAAAVALPVLVAALAQERPDSNYPLTPPGIPFLIVGLTAASLAGAARARTAIRNPAAAWIEMGFVTIVLGILLMPWVYWLAGAHWQVEIGSATPLGLYRLLPVAFVFAAFTWTGPAILLGAASWAVLVRALGPRLLPEREVESARQGRHRDGTCVKAVLVAMAVWAVAAIALVRLPSL